MPHQQLDPSTGLQARRHEGRGRNSFTVVLLRLTGLSLPLDDWLRSIQRVSDVEAQTTQAREILKVGERLDIKTFADRMRVCR